MATSLFTSHVSSPGKVLRTGLPSQNITLPKILVLVGALALAVGVYVFRLQGTLLQLEQTEREERGTVNFLEEVYGRPLLIDPKWRFLRSGALLKHLKSPPPPPDKNMKSYILVVMPYAPNQADAVKYSLKQWDILPPCEVADGPVGDLVFFTSKRDALLSVEQEGFKNPCFRRVEFLLSSIPPEMDQYRYAPPYMFFEIMLGNDPKTPGHHQVVKPDNDHMILMEPDVWPVKKNWLARAADDMRSHNFWIRGSRDRCPRPQDAEVDNNVNGNGFYRLHDQEFIDFLVRIKQHYLFGQMGEQKQEAYDYAINNFLKTTDDVNFRDHVISMIEITDVIFNHPHYPYKREQLADTAVLVHNKQHSKSRKGGSRSNLVYGCVLVVFVIGALGWRRRHRPQRIFQL